MLEKHQQTSSKTKSTLNQPGFVKKCVQKT